MKKSFSIPILLLVVLLLATFLVWPQYREFKDLKEQIKQKQAEFSETEKYLSELSQISEKLSNYQDSLEKIESALPQEFSLSSLLNFFQKESSENGLLLKNINQTEGERKEEPKGILAKVKETYINLSLTGTYPSLKGFLESLEKSSRLIEVENISINAAEKEFPEYNILIKVRHM